MTKLIPIKGALDLKLTPAQVRRAVGPSIMEAARAAILQERRMELAHDARRTDIAAYAAAVKTVTDALGRYEASVGTRDERRAIDNLVAACSGLRKSAKAVEALKLETKKVK